jgi:hypothetical protein
VFPQAFQRLRCKLPSKRTLNFIEASDTERDTA